MNKFTLHKDKSVLMVIDIQERLAKVMDRRDGVIKNTIHLIELAKLYKIPIVVTEQYPKGLGHTVNEIKEALNEYKPLEKLSFDCCSESSIDDTIRGLNRSQIIITGMETHICVLQTTLSLLKKGYDVHLVSDGVCSRTDDNMIVGLNMMRDAGAVITSTETALFQLLKIAGTEEFKLISMRIK
ncbi:MAG: hydrolase [Thermodesulfovibrionales bacterium]|nr:hydrolase [Thermodesulfovibrionales bacterium]